jgi:hypothetical protein
LYDVIADGGGDVGGLDRQAAAEMKVDLQFAVGLFF